MNKKPRKPKKPTKNNQNTPPRPTILRFEDEFKQVTYLRIMNNMTMDEITAMFYGSCVLENTIGAVRTAEDLLKLTNKEYREAKVGESMHKRRSRLDIIEWAIRQQLLVLLTDEESSLVEKQNTDTPA